MSLLWLGKFFKFMVFRLLENAFAFKKLKLGIFPLSPWKSLPKGFIITPQKKDNYSFRQEQERGKETMKTNFEMSIA